MWMGKRSRVCPCPLTCNLQTVIAAILLPLSCHTSHTFSDLYSECTQRTASSILMTQRTAAASSNCVFDSPSGSNPIYMLRERARLRATFNLRNSLEIIYNIFAVPCASYRFPLPAPFASPLEGRSTLRIRISGNAKSPSFLCCSLNATPSVFGHKLLTVASTGTDFQCQGEGGGNFMLCVAQIKKFLPKNV